MESVNFKETEGVPVKVSGQIINELSSKIPSNIFALNELIKNAYDAFSAKVILSIDANKKTIEITDFGHGMNRQAIEKLFHIGSSDKKYGEMKTIDNVTRYIQGSKGLGFLAAFKFGDKVIWESSNEGTKYAFEVLKTEMTDMDNITDYEVYIKESLSSTSGTKITVYSTEEIIEELIEYFEEDKNALKLVGSFPKEIMKIELNLPGGKKIKSENIPDLHAIYPKGQLFYIKYDSERSEVQFYNRGELIKEEEFELSSSEYSIQVEINIYSLMSHGKKNITELYHRESDGSLTPLIFINDNLFNNFTLFDPNVFRQRKSGLSLPQMIGKVNIYSRKSKVDFNSDRTNFVESSVTKLIARDLKKLNEFIQEKGSQLKKSLEQEDGKKIIGPARPAAGIENIEQPKAPKLKPAYIIIDETKLEQYVHSPQFDVTYLIKEAKNSKGEDIPVDFISITMDDEPLDNKIISSIDQPTELSLKFSYLDEATGNVITSALLRFSKRKSSITTDKEDVDLFWFESNTPYHLSTPVVSTMIKQISRAYQFRGQYNALIACSLRAIFELSIDKLRKKHGFIFTHQKKSKTEATKWDVMQVIAFIKKNNRLRTEMATKIDVEYTTLTNLLDMTGYCEALEGAHLGAHKSTSHLTTARIENIARYASNFAVFCDCLIMYFSSGEIKKYELADENYF
ncbi:ATP-binding protein [Aeromonas caviae]|uniref:ATP-binding protein n=1 Tax=Aeromonas caviae TaxID=648 RepID=UPI0029DB9FB3|nr:ATP-binding protein [Aeromonas caviae]MDX7893481.1 ATP-binding protein [Aeromonas caviae]